MTKLKITKLGYIWLYSNYFVIIKKTKFRDKILEYKRKEYIQYIIN